MPNIPYFITEDLEATAWVPTDALYDLRNRSANALKNAFSKQVQLRLEPHKKGVDFFWGRMRDKAFSITADDGVYTKNADLNFSSTRMYSNEESILTKGAYQVLTRDGNALPKNIQIPENESRVTIYDDGIFSGDTLIAIMNILDKKDLDIMVNVLLNFSGKTKKSIK